MPLFDRYVAVDWSAKATHALGANSIWIAVCDAGGIQELENPPTRREAVDRIETLLGAAREEGLPDRGRYRVFTVGHSE